MCNKLYLRWVLYSVIFVWVCGLTACKKLPNPVQRKDGVSYIPIMDTAFLIPDETWLKSYARNSSDGKVSSFSLHATVPDVQPWSQARHNEMYPHPGVRGKLLLIHIDSYEVAGRIKYFHQVPNSIYGKSYDLIEEPSDQTKQGLRKFRWVYPAYNEANAKKDAAKHGESYVQWSRDHAGKPVSAGDQHIFYELVENGNVKYFIHCGRGIIYADCNLLFPWTQTLMANIYFARGDMEHIVAMADKVNARLHEFEAAGLAYRATHPTFPPPSSLPRRPSNIFMTFVLQP